MSTHEVNSSIGFFESRLASIAQTDRWDADGIIDNIRNYQAMLKTLRDKVDGVRSWMVQSGDFDCSAQDSMYAKAKEVVDNIDDHFAANQQCLTDMKRAIEAHNEGIIEANNVTLPGSRLNAAQEQQIMDATEPMNVVVPGLGTLTGMMGIAGVNLISQLMVSHREDEAEKKYNAIINSVRGAVVSPPDPIPVVDMGQTPDGWPIPDHSQSGDGSGPSSVGAGVGAGATAAGVGVAAAARAGRSSASSVAAVSAGRSSSAGSGAAGSLAGAARPLGTLQGGADRANGSSGSAGRDGYRVGGSNDDDRHDDYLYEWDENGTYRYDSDRNAWVRTDADGVDVDSYSMRGVTGLSSAASAGGVAAAGVAATGVAGRAGMMSSAAGGALMGSAGAGGTLGLVGAVGGTGVGSFYANNPVTATVSSASSIRGAQGLAAGLRNNAAAAGAAGAAGRANPAMMGSGAGAGGAGGDKKKRQQLGYVAPVIEEDEEFSPTPIGNMAGRRRSAQEA
ncbi:hypothetical protein CGZ88_0896 [Bifidobacterium anseris]|uniref:Uncharacterized protein n=2 Tax=Bifidobacterium TaxID=1678 RepID=A0A2A2EKG0_9BIFI|nr:MULTISPECIES: hypothetical protein [Bifidobacterium]PAU69714.1 hypothetical protein B1400_0593 [Bifidobacterium italicum]PLS27369.1 hypothetical protein CGZ88_0896 [Bifidobacterium anseris]